MAGKSPSFSHDRDAHQIRGLCSLALSLILLVALFRFWPAPSGNTGSPDFQSPERPQEIIELELIDATVQNQTMPPPPPPPQEVMLPPVEVPDTRIIEERVQELEFSLPAVDTNPSAPPAPPPAQPGPPQAPSPPPEQPTLVRTPDRSPVPVRFSEPVYPQAARDEGVRARVRIEVLVDEHGRVTEARITERIRLGRGDREESVASLPHGIDESALAAARRYQFRPARHDGRAVLSYTMITCNFGV